MNKLEHIEGIDYLRAAMSVFVVIWHMGGGGRSLIFSATGYMNHTFIFSDFINFHVLLLAVPLFILISNYLFNLKGPSFQYLRRRLRRLFLLYSFWFTALILWGSGHYGFIKMFPDSFSPFIVMILKGRGIHYFFICLMFTLSATYLISKLRTSLIVLGFILSIICHFLIPIIANMLAFYPLSAYWSPSSFIPYPFAAILLVRLSDYIFRLRIQVVISALILAVIFSCIEWNIDFQEVFIREGGFGMPTYARVSVLFSAIALLVIAINPKIRSPRIIKFMSVHALALYCIHIFFIEYAKNIVVIHFHSSFIWLYVVTVIIIGCSYMISLMLSFYLKEEIIR